jgi:GNAT superfamily N-acetyltransferase
MTRLISGTPISARDAAPSRRPSQLRLPGGEHVTVRPIRPGDAGRLQAYVGGLSIDSRRNRFLGALNELSQSELARLCGMDRPDEITWVAFASAATEPMMIGEAVQVIGPDGARCEFAVSVTDPWQRRGLGSALLRIVECRARARGARHLFGEVLRTNTAMKCFARKAGFSIRSPITDARLVEIVRDLAQADSGAPCPELADVA